MFRFTPTIDMFRFTPTKFRTAARPKRARRRCRPKRVILDWRRGDSASQLNSSARPNKILAERGRGVVKSRNRPPFWVTLYLELLTKVGQKVLRIPSPCFFNVFQFRL